MISSIFLLICYKANILNYYKTWENGEWKYGEWKDGKMEKLMFQSFNLSMFQSFNVSMFQSFNSLAVYHG